MAAPVEPQRHEDINNISNSNNDNKSKHNNNDEAEEDDEAVAASLSRSLARHLNALGDESRPARRRALDALVRETLGRERPLSGGAVRAALDASLLRPALRCLVRDQAESCREVAARLLAGCLGATSRPEEALPYVVAAVVGRLAAGGDGGGGGEPSEELRLALVRLLSLAVSRCDPAAVTPHGEELVRALRSCIVDPFPEVKKESCRFASQLAASLPEHFHMYSEQLIKPLMQTLTHQHSRVRVAAVLTTGAVVRYGNNKSVNDALPHLAQRLFDDASTVRQAVTDVVGTWLLELPDRYSFFHKLIPLLLSSLSDEMPDVRNSATEYWKRVGQQWEHENEEDLKDKMDFELPPSSLYPAGVERPCLGCRELVQRNLSRVLPAVARDAGDWVVGTRTKASQLLVWLMVHAEDHATQHAELLVATLHRACADDEPQVVNNAVRSAELLGAFVNPEVFCKLALPALHRSPSPSHLAPISAFIRGSSAELLAPHVASIADALAHPDVAQASEKVVYHQELVTCVQALVSTCGEQCRNVTFQLLQLLLSSSALCGESSLQAQVQEATRGLTTAAGFEGPAALLRAHMRPLLAWLGGSSQQWTSHAVERLIFDTLLFQAGPMVGEFLPEVMPIFRDLLQPNKEPELRLKVFAVLSKLLLNAQETVNSQGQFAGFLQELIKAMIVPNLVWHAGRTAAAIRTTAVSCLWALLHGGMVTPEQASAVSGELLPQAVAVLDEDSKTSRLLACRALRIVLQLLSEKGCDADALNKIYPEVLKRLDDASDEVRIAAARCFSAWFGCVGGDYDRGLYRAHLEFLYRGLLVHLDDPDAGIQAAVLDVLKQGGRVSPELLQQEVEAVKHKHRSPLHCDALVQHLQHLTST
ncbi:unnamed protein product [Lampetra fluviatilis]